MASITRDGVVFSNIGESPKFVLCQDTGKEEKYEDCVLVGSRYYLKTSDRIATDYMDGRIHPKDAMSEVLEDFTIKDGKLLDKKICYTKYSKQLPYIELSRGDSYYIKNVKIATDNGLKEDYRSGTFCEVIPKKSEYKRYEKFNYSKVRDYQYGGLSKTHLITEGKKYTFGLEIETCVGLVPARVAENLNLDCVHDGSLRDEDGEVRGGEYVTGVLVGDSGILQLQKICFELSRRCKINHRCSVHVHFGNIDFNKEFIVFSYYLSQILEAEIFSMLAPSRRNNVYCKAIKHIDFKFPKFESKNEYKIYIEEKYNQIYHIISCGKYNPSRDYNKKTEHPLGHKCGYNQKSPRYWWINYVPAMFNTRGNEEYTLEFRAHQGSMNFNKIKNWLLICMGILYFCENNKQDIMNGYILVNGEKEGINLPNIMKIAYPKKYRKLNEYIKSRKLKLSKSIDENEEEYNNEEETVETNIKQLI